MNILLVGQMGSGKDTVADILVEKYGYTNHKLGLYIRKHVDEIYSHLDAAQRRPYYQAYGETLRENIDIDIWNDSCKSRIDFENEKVVISDCRQPHEIEYWTKIGFTPVGIYVTEKQRIERLLSRDGTNFNADSFNHSTEINAKNIIVDIINGEIGGYVLNNSYHKDILESKIGELFN